MLLREIGCANLTRRLLKYDQTEPRVPANSGPHGGEWTGTGGADGEAASGHDATIQPVATTTTDFDDACKKLKIDPVEAGAAIHAAKDGLVGAAEDCTFDLRTGDIIFDGEIIGNLRD